MSLKIIIFESKIPEDKRYETEYLEDSDLETSIVGSFDSILDIMNNASPDILDSLLIDLKLNGWVKIRDIKNREDRLKALKEYFIMDTKGWDDPEKIDIDQMSSYKLKDLASGRSHLVQKISNDCLTGESKVKYDKAVKAHKKAEKTRVRQQKEREKKKAERKIEKAKKILEKEGIKIQ